MQTDPPEPDDDLLIALANVYREQEAAAAAAWPSEVEAFVPIEGTEADALFDRIHAASTPSEPERRGRVLQFPTRPVVAAAIALAAGLLLFVFTHRSDGPQPLPDYTLTTLSGDQLNRADGPKNGKRARYTPGSRVLLVAKPAAGIDRQISAQIHVRQKGKTIRVEAPVQLSASGALRVDLVVGETVRMVPGDGELIILLIPDGMNAADRTLLDAADPTPARRLVHRFTYAP